MNVHMHWHETTELTKIHSTVPSTTGIHSEFLHMLHIHLHYAYIFIQQISYSDNPSLYRRETHENMCIFVHKFFNLKKM
jgi:hypothetical protein